jgi:hypothetical protein
MHPAVHSFRIHQEGLLSAVSRFGLLRVGSRTWRARVPRVRLSRLYDSLVDDDETASLP